MRRKSFGAASIPAERDQARGPPASDAQESQSNYSRPPRYSLLFRRFFDAPPHDPFAGSLPHHVQRETADGRIVPASQVDEIDLEPELFARVVAFRHPGFLPLHAVAEGGYFQEEVRGIGLGTALDLAGGDVPRFWKRVYRSGRAGLLWSFAELTHAAAALEAAGIPAALGDLDDIQVGCDGRLFVRAYDLLALNSRAENSESEANGGANAMAARDLYLPPEEFLAARPLAPSSRDGRVAYRLAALLHHALSGTPPYPGRDRTEIAHRMLACEELPLARRRRDLPAGIAPYLRDALSVDPSLRPATLRAFARGLVAAAEGEYPRAAPMRETASSPSLLFRAGIAAALIIAVALAIWLGVHGREKNGDELVDSLAAVLHARPFPIHGEDPPLADAARPMLGDLAPRLDGFLHNRRVQLYRGWAHLRAGELEDAKGIFRQVVTHSRRSAAGWISLGIARLEEGDRAGATDLAHGLALPRDGEEDRLFAGAGYFYLGEFTEAAAAFRALVDTHDRSFAGWYHLALSEFYRGEIVAARAALLRASALHPENLWVIWLEAEILAADGMTDMRHRLRKQKARFVANPALLLRAGYLLEATGEQVEGRAWVTQAVARIFDSASGCCEAAGRGRVTVPARNVLWYGPPSALAEGGEAARGTCMPPLAPPSDPH